MSWPRLTQMNIVVESETRLRLDIAGEEFALSSEGPAVSPFHLLAASLASCTVLTVASWAAVAGIDTTGLAAAVEWRMTAERPKRVAHFDMELRWPALPPERMAAAERAADLCPIHATLKTPTSVSRRITPGR
jgi:uncharacterized OsmC-like protein